MTSCALPTLHHVVLAALAGLLTACVPELDDAEEDCENCDQVRNRHRGSACRYDWQCSADEGLTCAPVERTEYGNDKRKQCLAPVGAGAMCDDADDCAEDLVCLPLQRFDFPGYFFNETEYAGLCAASSQRHGVCNQDDDCVGDLECHPVANDDTGLKKCEHDSCFIDAACPDGTVCRPDREMLEYDEATQFSRSRCQRIGAAGATCEEDDDCVSGLVCGAVGTDGWGSCLAP